MSTETETANSNPATPPTINLSDVAFAIQLIEVSQKRGTFEMDEMGGVSRLYNRLKSFLEYHTPVDVDSDSDAG